MVLEPKNRVLEPRVPEPKKISYGVGEFGFWRKNDFDNFFRVS